MRPFTNRSIKENSISCNFDPSELPSHILDQLHGLATQKGLDGITEKIEEEMFSRVKERVERRDEVERWYELTLQEIRTGE